MKPRYKLDDEAYEPCIVDTKNGKNVFFLATTGFGVHSDTLKLAQRVVEFLNMEEE